MRLFLTTIFFFLISQIGLSQTTQGEYIKDVKRLYVQGEKFESDAKEKIKEGLKKHPNSEGLLKLKELLKVEIENPKNVNAQTIVRNPQPVNSNNQSIVTTNSANVEPKQVPIVVKKINVGLSMPSQNLFTWNKSLAEEGVKMTIVIRTGSGAEYQKDVTGQESFKFKSGDTRFDGVECTVYLVIEDSENVIIQNNQRIKAKTTC